MENSGGADQTNSAGARSLEEKIDFEEPTPLIDQVYLGCTQRETLTKEQDVKINRDNLNSKPGLISETLRYAT